MASEAPSLAVPPSLSPSQRAAELLTRMSPEEKVAQMTYIWNDKATTLVDSTGAFDHVNARKSCAGSYGLGQVRRPSDAGGGRAGTETFQLYVHDQTSSVIRPLKELKGFRRVGVQPGETQTVSFDVTPDALAFWDIDVNYVVEPGDFDLLVGSSSRDDDLQQITLRVS